MYRILVLNDSKQDIQLNNEVKYIKSNELTKELKNSEYDLIYLNNGIKTNSIEKTLLADYMYLPIKMKKLAVMNDAKNTYINLQIVNKLIFDNLEIVEFENYIEKMTIAIILKEFLTENIEYSKIISKICTKELQEKDINKIVSKIVKRDYAAKNILRKYKYHLNYERINSKFFENILINIKNDINKMEEP